MKRKPKKKLQYKGWRAGAAKNASKRVWKKRKSRSQTYCKYCGAGFDLGQPASPIKPFSKTYDRMCPVRDGDLCERA